MDRLMSGIAAGKLQRDRSFPLWLQREELIPELFYSPTPRKYVKTKSYATYLELEHQHKNSWWAKYLVGLVYATLAALLFYEITAIEAGRGRLEDWGQTWFIGFSSIEKTNKPSLISTG